MELNSLTYFVCNEGGLPYISAYHRHTSQMVYIEAKYLHHYLIDQGTMSKHTKLSEWTRRYFRRVVRNGLLADSVHLTCKSTGKLNQHVAEVRAFLEILLFNTTHVKPSVPAACIIAFLSIIPLGLESVPDGVVCWVDVAIYGHSSGSVALKQVVSDNIL